MPVVINRVGAIGVEVNRSILNRGWGDDRPELVRINWYHWGSQGHLYNHWKLHGSLDDFPDHIEAARAIGVEPIVVFMGNPPGECSPPEDWRAYIDFIALQAKVFELRYVEIWNEPDFKGGHPDIYGCLGDAGLLNEMVAYARERFPHETEIGTSVSGVNRESFQFAEALAGFDWLGLHRYAVWIDGTQEDPPADPGTVEFRWITEANVLNDETCTQEDPAYLKAQRDYVWGLAGQYEGVVIYAYTNQPFWRCAAIFNRSGAPLPIHDLIKED